MKILITCEHGGNHIPAAYEPLFEGIERRLESHEGWDIGALEVAKQFHERVGGYLCYTEVSRLLVELNRSLRHPKLFSDITKACPIEVKNYLLAQYYLPYRNQVSNTIENVLRQGRSILHLSVHSFTPSMNGIERNADIGFLYDPRRLSEKTFCASWKSALSKQANYLTTRYNYPYLGKADGLVTSLRRQFPADKYAGIELEINQKHLFSVNSIQQMADVLISSFKKIITT